MITNNYNALVDTILMYGIGSLPVVTTSNETKYAIGANITLPTSTAVSTGSGSGIHIGSGTTAASASDYKLETQIKSGFSSSIISTKALDANNNPIRRYDVTITNTGSSDLSISEIGFVANSMYANSVGGSSANINGAFLIDRTVLSEPVTIAAGDYETIRYEFTLSGN